MENFLAMGGYAAYVWPAYAVSLIGLIGAAIWTVSAERRLRLRLSAIESQR